MQLYVEAAENTSKNFFLLSVQIKHACIITALYKLGSFLTVRAGYILPGYILSKEFHRQMWEAYHL